MRVKPGTAAPMVLTLFSCLRVWIKHKTDFQTLQKKGRILHLDAFDVRADELTFLLTETYTLLL